MDYFRRDNTEGYSDEELRTLNLRFASRCNMLLNQYKDDDFIREQIMQRWGEEILADFDATHGGWKQPTTGTADDPTPF